MEVYDGVSGSVYVGVGTTASVHGVALICVYIDAGERGILHTPPYRYSPDLLSRPEGQRMLGKLMYRRTEFSRRSRQ